jgi:hypothetical protein
MGIEGWRRKAQDRDQWRRIAQEDKAHEGLKRQVMVVVVVIIIIIIIIIIIMSVLKIWLANTVKQTMLARIAQFKKKSG